MGRRLSLVATVFLVLLAAGCSTEPADRQLESNSAGLSAEAPALPPKADEARVRTAQDQALRAEALVSQLRPFMTDPGASVANIRFNYSDNVKRFWGDGLAIDLAAMGCASERPTDAIGCFFSKTTDAFGIDPSRQDFSLVGTTGLKSGHAIHRFRQHLEGYPVRGSDFIVTLDPQGRLTRVVSHYVKGLAVRPGAPLADRFKAADRAAILGNIRKKLNRDDLESVAEKEIVWVDQEKESLVGFPALQVTVKDSQSWHTDAIADAETGEILQVVRKTMAYAAKQLNKTMVAYQAFSSNGCSNPGEYCSPYVPPPIWTCSNDTHKFSIPHYLCEDMCTTDAECNSASQGWKCWTADPTFPNYCYRDGFDGPGENLEIHNASGWVQTGYQYLVRWSDLKAKMDDVIQFHYDDLGRNGWSGTDANYHTVLVSHDCQPGLACKFGEMAPGKRNWWDGQADQVNSKVLIQSWQNFGVQNNPSNSFNYDLLSHEYAHLIEATYGDMADSSCMSEGIAYMYGALMAVKKVGSSTAWDDGPCTLSTWNDDRSGLSPSCRSFVPLPYADRSYFDWIPCSYVDPRQPAPPCGGENECVSDSDCVFGVCVVEQCYCQDSYQCIVPTDMCDTWQCYRNGQPVKRCLRYGQDTDNLHNNYAIWTRFVRVLALGPSVLSSDGHNENVGVTFTGVGWDKAVDIVYDATTHITDNDKLDDWIENVQSAGSNANRLSQTRMALGIAGFPIIDANPGIGTTDRAFSIYEFTAWQLHSVKAFWVWRPAGTSNLKVRYFKSTGAQIDTISANTDSAPAVVEWNERLYIFWRDQSSSNVKFKYYYKDGTTSSIYDLGSKNIKSKGSFDATVFNNVLYLVYPYGDNRTVSLSKCTVSPCTTGTWYTWGSPSYYVKPLDYSAFPGMGAETVSSLNGTGSNTYLYIVSASYPADSNQYRIRIDQVQSNDTVKHSTWTNQYNLSFRTDKEIGIRAMPSAFPAAGNYLYFSWKLRNSSFVYLSALQRLDDVDDSDTRITPPAETFIYTNNGVRLSKGGTLSGRIQTDFATSDLAGNLMMVYLYGRY